MAEQPGPNDVVFYCDACARRSGDRHVLAAADRDAGAGSGTTYPSDGWRLWLARRGGRKVMVSLNSGRQVPVVAIVTPTIGGHRHGPHRKLARVLQPGGRRFVLVSLDAAAAELICYSCPARPRRSRAALVEQAEQTVAAGRRDAYI